MYRLAGTQDREAAVISNPKAVAMALPVVVVQVIILAIFSILDPPHPENLIEFDGTVVVQRVECSTNSYAFSITVLVYEASLVSIGCVLAFVTRNLDSGFGQAKELVFSMYNIAFSGVVIMVITFAVDIDASGQIILNSLGIFCATVFSSAAFVLPRVMQSQQEELVRKRSARNLQPEKSKKSNRSVNFSQKIAQDMDDPEKRVTGWSAVEDDLEDAATGIKRASSVASMAEDEAWTQANDNGSLISGSLISGSLLGGSRQPPNFEMEKSESYREESYRDVSDRDETWRSSDITDPQHSSVLPSPPPPHGRKLNRNFST